MSELYNTKRVAELKAQYAPTATPEQLAAWITECKTRNAVPGIDIYLQIRPTKEWDPIKKESVYKNKAIFVSSVGFLRKIAQRSGEYAGQLPSVWLYLDADGMPTISSEVPLKDKHPYAAKASVLRKGWVHPLTVPARWDAYVQTYKDKKTGLQVVNPTWSSRGAEQLEKCAEALALRKAFPEELDGLIDDTHEEPEIEPVAEKKVRKKNGNAHGVNITDDDVGLPTAADLDRHAEEQKARTATDPQVTLDERKEFSLRLRKYSEIVGTDQLKAFVILKAGTPDLRIATRKQYTAALSLLDACNNDHGALKALVNGENNVSIS